MHGTVLSQVLSQISIQGNSPFFRAATYIWTSGRLGAAGPTPVGVRGRMPASYKAVGFRGDKLLGDTRPKAKRLTWNLKFIY